MSVSQAIESNDNNSSGIKAKVVKIIAEKLGRNEAEISHDDCNLEKDLEADSLDRVELMMHFEEEFGISIPDDAGEPSLATIKEIVDYIESQS